MSKLSQLLVGIVVIAMVGCAPAQTALPSAGSSPGGEIADIAVSDLPLLPVYFAMASSLVRKGVVALADDYAATRGIGLISRNAHLWDREF